jgi:hypothetical protein
MDYNFHRQPQGETKMAEFSVHNVKSIRISDIREHDSFVTRTIHIEDDKGETHEVTLFSNHVDDEETLRVWL